MARDRRSACVAFAALVVVAAGLAGATAPPLVGQTQVDPDTTILRVDLRANGDAAWTIEYWVRLDDENTTAAFESLQADVRENRSAFAAQFAERMRRTVRAAENATGREMAIRDVNVTTRRTAIPQEYGVLTYTFVWEGFAVVDGPRLRAGDALAGLFLEEGTTLVIAWPEEYRLIEHDPPPDEEGSRSVTWRGPITFSSGEPRIVVTSAPAATTATTTTTTTAPPTETTVGTTAATPPTTTSAPGPGGEDGRKGGGLPILPMIAALLVLALAGAGGWVYRRRGQPSEGGGDGAAAAADDEDATPPDELLSNEEQVLRVLEEHGGRMKQQQVASELDWTDAKTSQVVGDLREAGEIEVFRLGRENVLALPEESDI